MNKNDIIIEMVKGLPAIQKQKFLDFNWVDVLDNLYKKYQIHDDITSLLNEEVISVLLNDQTYDEFVEYFNYYLSDLYSDDLVSKLIVDIRKDVLEKIKGDLDSVGKNKGKKNLFNMMRKK